MTEQDKKSIPYSTTFQRLSAMKEAVGQELGISKWITITQERINTFAEVTEDLQWVHTNVEKAKQDSPYKTTIAHGFLVLSLASKIAYDTFQVDDVGMGINYGLDKVRFMNATPVKSKIRGRLSLMEFEEISGGAKYKMKIIFEIQGQEKPACVAEFIAMAFTK